MSVLWGFEGSGVRGLVGEGGREGGRLNKKNGGWIGEGVGGGGPSTGSRGNK